ncbi:hypothetical protein glysoja_008454 [Glycine soja]|nr:hypothetical protein glysoja_008454 [Glycine soja]
MRMVLQQISPKRHCVAVGAFFQSSSSPHIFKGGAVEDTCGEGASNSNGNSKDAAFKGGAVEDAVAAFFESLFLLIQF